MQAELPDVVGAVADPHWREPPLSADVSISHRLDPRPGERFTELVEDAAGDDTGTRQGDVELLDGLSFGELQDLARFERTLLTVGDVDVSTLADGHAIASGRETLQLPSAVRVGGDGPSLRRFLR